MKKIPSSLALITLLIPSIGFSASFDCTKATSVTEKLICTDEKLSALDEQLASSYKKALEAATDKDAVKKTQIEWLKGQRACKDTECLGEIYQARINGLNKKDVVVAQSEKHSTKSKYTFTQGPNGHQLQLCKDYLELINRVPKNPKPNCGMDFTFDDIARKQGFKEIPWVELNAKEHMDLIKNAFVYQSSDSDQKLISRNEKYFETISDPTTIHLWTANFDLNLDGKVDKVYKIQFRNCDAGALIMITREGGALDNMVSHRLTTSDEPFFYQGRAYLQGLGVIEGFGSEAYLFTRQACNISVNE